MARIIKIKCNGPAQDVNEVDLDKALDVDIVLRSASPDDGSEDLADLPGRVSLPCKHCAVGRVVMTHDMLADILSRFL